MKRSCPLVIAGALLLAIPLVLAMASMAQDEPSEITFVYEATINGKDAGRVDAVWKGGSLTIDSAIHTVFLGKDVEIESATKVKYDDEGQATWFDIDHETPTSTIHVIGTRKESGWSIKRTKDGGKTEKLTIAHESYDHVSIEPTLWAAEVGTKTKCNVLFAGKGEVGKATIWVLDRKEKTVLDRETVVTHFRLKDGMVKVEEWRTAENVMIKSVYKTPIGKIVVKLKKASISPFL